MTCSFRIPAWATEALSAQPQIQTMITSHCIVHSMLTSDFPSNPRLCCRSGLARVPLAGGGGRAASAAAGCGGAVARGAASKCKPPSPPPPAAPGSPAAGPAAPASAAGSAHAGEIACGCDAMLCSLSRLAHCVAHASNAHQCNPQLLSDFFTAWNMELIVPAHDRQHVASACRRCI